ncbi:hypothetical protein RHSIM_Rhsim01G0193200 [Rhododendron simsii]|uniref:Glucan endo-1,3-beta-D-glucosidase n=1 Tax=Rhododendron simsii TaxID=118357 RepID=A0A834HD31_RHOSS|nr:hypothetical protein RHSIM_Rhsim01G0193200 [Rhododendron simsii]
MRIYDPNPEALQALQGSGIELMLDVPNNDLEGLANDAAAASKWVQDNILNYNPDVKFRIIAVGNEVDPNNSATARFIPFVLDAMSKIYDAIASAGLKDQIKVSTATYSALVSNPYPPSEGSFNGESGSFMGPIINFLKNTNNPLLFNIYPYFARTGDPQNVPLPYALFTQTGDFPQDGQNQYKNLFDAMLDAAYSAVEKAGGANVEIVVSESGWPSEGGNDASVENAGTYYRNLIDHVKGGSGTPKRPGKAIETYLFAMFDENEKTGLESEKYFGIFSPNKQPKYGQLSFN